MINLLRDPLWQFVGVLLALLALAATFIVYLLQRQRKSLSYEVLTKNQLLTVREELEGKLQVLYEGQPAKDICLLLIKLFNSGNVPVATVDYERPISFIIGDSSKVISAVVTDLDPENLPVNITSESNRVFVNPVLLNPKDSITLKILVHDISGGISADSRIVGVKSIKNAGEASGFHRVLLVPGLLLTVAGMYLVIKYIPRQVPEPPIPIEMKLGIGVFAIGYILLISTVVKSRKVLRLFIRRIAKRG